MRIRADDGVMVLEGPAELEAAVIVCQRAARSRWRRSRDTSERAQRIVDEASRADALGWRGGNPDRCLHLDHADATVLVEASRRFTPPRRGPVLRGDPEINAAAQRFAEAQL